MTSKPTPEVLCDLCFEVTSNYVTVDGTPHMGTGWHTNVCAPCNNPETPRALRAQLHERAVHEQRAIHTDFGTRDLDRFEAAEVLDRWQVVLELLEAAESARMVAEALEDAVPLADRSPLRALPIRDWLPEVLQAEEPKLGQLDIFEAVAS